MKRLVKVWGLAYSEWTWLLAGFLLLAYELWAVATDNDVLTRAYRANATRWTVFPVGIGIIIGHLHVPIHAGIFGKWSPVLFITVTAIALARDLFVGTRINFGWVLPLLLLGLVVGCVSWVGSPE